MNVAARKAVRQVEKWLRATFPAKLPCTVRIVAALEDEGAELLGIAKLNDRRNRFEIQLAAGQSSAVAIETLMHEWAHTLVLPLMSPGDGTSHTPEFWLAYGRIYNAFHEGGGAEAAKKL